LKVYFDRAAFYLTCGSLVSILFSIAVSQILLGLGLAALLLSSERIRLPPIKLPLVLFMAGTVLALLFSGHVREGTPQIRKFLVFAILLLVYSTFRSVAQIRGIVLAWTGVATLSAVRSLFQFWQKYQESQELGQNFYTFYVGERITGFMSHWMTLGVEEMIVMLMLASYLFFARDQRWKAAGWLCGAVLAISLVLGFTRSIFLLGFPVGLLYLLWFWHRWLVAAAPVVAVIGFLVAPQALKERVISIVQPHGQLDSNEHRYITRRTGVAMIRAHPLLGLGPEQVKYQFDQWVPPDIPKPLPEGWYGHLHNIYLQYAAERGIPTMLCIMWMIAKILWDFVTGLRKMPLGAEGRFVLQGGIAVILGILAEGFFDYNLGDSEVLTMFLAVVGFGYIAKETAKVEA
jgi:putative inorganic carbon (HCO3(-)) transporter